MKKLLLALLIVGVIAGTALAVKNISLQNTVMRQTDIRLNYDNDGSATADITVVYEICDVDCTFVKEESKKFLWDDLPAQTQNTLRIFLQFLDQEFRNEKINENNSDMVFK